MLHVSNTFLRRQQMKVMKFVTLDRFLENLDSMSNFDSPLLEYVLMDSVCSKS